MVAMPEPKPERSFNSRTYQRKIERELILGGIVITIVLGGGLIFLFWGPDAFFSALVCFGLALGLGVLIWLILKLFELGSLR